MKKAKIIKEKTACFSVMFLVHWSSRMLSLMKQDNAASLVFLNLYYSGQSFKKGKIKCLVNLVG